MKTHSDNASISGGYASSVHYAPKTPGVADMDGLPPLLLNAIYVAAMPPTELELPEVICTSSAIIYSCAYIRNLLATG